MNGKRSAAARFGAGNAWLLSGGRRLDIGEAVTSAGPGQGFAMMPWALMQYGRALRLRPAEAWVLATLLAHAWEFDGLVFPSLRKMSTGAQIGRATLWRTLRNLQRLGYIRCVGAGPGGDRRKRFDVRGVYSALAICIAVDPTSAWAKAHGVLDRDEARQLRGPNGQTFDLDFGAIDALARRTEGTEPDGIDPEEEG